MTLRARTAVSLLNCGKVAATGLLLCSAGSCRKVGQSDGREGALLSGRSVACCAADLRALALQENKQLPDTPFEPNLVNSVCFLVNWIVQLTTFGVNYIGHPFNTSLQDNKGLAVCLRCGFSQRHCQAFYVAAASCAQ